MARSDDFLMTPGELAHRALRRRRLAIAIGLVVAVLVLGYFSARPASHAVKAWQARRHAAKAFAFLEKEKWTEARGEAIAGYRLWPNEPQALRAVARYLSRTRQQEALDFWKLLEKEQPLSREDRRDEAMIALTAGETARAAAAINDLLTRKDSPAGPPDWIIAAQAAMQKGEPEEASPFLQKVFAAPGATEREQLQAALIQLALSGNFHSPEAQEEEKSSAWKKINKLAQGKSEAALDALLVLGQRELAAQGTAPSFLPSATELAQSLRSHPLAKTPQKLLAFDLDIHVDPARRDELIAKAIAQWKDADATSAAALAGWLNSKAEYQLELDAIPLAKALQTRDLFLHRVDALGGLDRWAEIKSLLLDERFPLDRVRQQMYLARCSAQLGEKTAAANNWQRALEAAAGDTGNLLALADYAEKNGANEIAAAAFTAAATELPKLRIAQQGRLRMAQAGGDTKKIHAILAEMLKLWPNDSAIQNDEAYLRLLLLPNKSEAGSQKSEAGDPKSEVSSSSSEFAAIEKLAADLVKREPASLPHRTLLALALLKQNRAADALQAYADIRLAPKALTPSALAVHSAVLAATGHDADAQTEAEKLPLDKLLPEERALVPGQGKSGDE